MKNTVQKKVLASAMLLAFALSNSSAAVLASGITGNFGSSISESLLAQDAEGIRGFNSSSVLPDVFSGVSTQGTNSDSFYKPTETIKLRGDVSLTDKDIPVTLSLRDSDVMQVLRMFADKAGLNIIFDKDVSGSVTWTW